MLTSTESLPPLRAALPVWLRIGLLSFGGPAGQIALMHRELVDARHWVGERTFLRGLSFCALLPGPEAQQLATYLGTLAHGPAGGAIAGTLFVLPGAAVLLALSIAYVTLGHVPAVAGLFFGLACAVLALVGHALLRLGRRALRTTPARAVAVAAFLALAVARAPFPLVVLAAGLLGAAQPTWFGAGHHGTARADTPGLVEAAMAADPARPARLAAAARRAGLATLAFWLAPVAALAAVGGRWFDIAWFFSKMAVVTIGGAYAVLAYVAQDAVHAYGWLASSEMLTGLGFAETTPGPLILVLQFVGFLAGYRAPGPLSGLAGGIAASLLVLWVTFLPCFTFVFLGAPLIERLADSRRLGAALAAIAAAIVGVIANLALWFGLHVLFGRTASVVLAGIQLDLPDPASLRWEAAALALLAAGLLARGAGVPVVLGVCAALGMAWRLLVA